MRGRTRCRSVRSPERCSHREPGPAARAMPVEPRCIWDFPDPALADAHEEIIAIGADLEPGTLLGAYRRGLFPMYAGRALAWWSPDPRGIIPLDGFHRSRSLT